MTITKPTVTNSFTANTFAKSSEVNANFTDLLNEFEDNGYIAKGWIAIDNASFEYQASNAIKTTADVDLTGLLQVGDKLTFEQATDGEKFFFITAIDYNSTVANRTYIEVYGGTDYDVDNEAITANTVGFSRVDSPFGWPSDLEIVFCRLDLSASQTAANGDTVEFDSFVQNINCTDAFDTSTHTFTAPVKGIYEMSVQLAIDNPSSGQRHGLQIITNATQNIATREHASNSNGLYPDLAFSIAMNKGQTAYVRFDGDSTESINGASTLTYWTINLTKMRF